MMYNYFLFAICYGYLRMAMAASGIFGHGRILVVNVIRGASGRSVAFCLLEPLTFGEI